MLISDMFLDSITVQKNKMIYIDILLIILALQSILLLESVYCDTLPTTNDMSSSDESWQEWKTKFDKNYVSTEEEVIRRRLWTQKVARVNAHNKNYELGIESYKKAVYGWADQKEFSQNCVNEDLQFCYSAVDETLKVEVNRSVLMWPKRIPKSIDYRKKGFVSSVDQQEECGCCWAFAVTGVIEGFMKKTTDKMEKLSTQQLLDCTAMNADCNGGSSIDAMRYARVHGMQTDKNYPFEAEKKSCRYDPKHVVFNIEAFMKQCNLSERELKAYVATVGPIAVNIVTTPSFIDYKDGIYSTDECKDGMKTNHMILIVGYGYEGARRYWILKNSYGESWGEKGFMRFERKIGLCGIGRGCIWPIS